MKFELIVFFLVIVKTSPLYANILGKEQMAVRSHLSKSVGGFSLSPNYNKFELPVLNGSGRVFCNIRLVIDTIENVDTKNEIVELDSSLEISWVDPRISVSTGAQKGHFHPDVEGVSVDAAYLDNIWKPDILIDGLKSIETVSLLTKPVILRFRADQSTPEGVVVAVKFKQRMKLRCEMDFRYYPADKQKCFFIIRSYGHPISSFQLVWDLARLETIANSNFDFQLSDVEPGMSQNAVEVTDGTCGCVYSALTFVLQIRRNLTHHFVQTYLSSIILVTITWLCFLIPPNLIDVRIGVSMTSLLTLTAMFSSVREKAPEVSYVSLMDIWMIFTMILIFMALSLFIVLHWMKRKVPASKENSRDDGPAIVATDEGQASNDLGFAKQVNEYDRYLFPIFFLAFMLFLSIYSYIIFIGSGYYNWNPSSIHNALIDSQKVHKFTYFPKNV